MTDPTKVIVTKSSLCLQTEFMRQTCVISYQRMHIEW
jgi:hypothetical protein